LKIFLSSFIRRLDAAAAIEISRASSFSITVFGLYLGTLPTSKPQISRHLPSVRILPRDSQQGIDFRDQGFEFP
jgi:hypothetical protein